MNQFKIKQFWQSRTFWTAIVAGVGTFTMNYLGYEIPAELQVTILSVIFFLLRLDTKTPIQF